MTIDAKELTFNARQVMGLLEQAEAGYHALFDAETIRRALEADDPPQVGDEAVEHVQAAIETLSRLEKIADVRAYIGSLPEPQQNLLVHLYFRFLDQFMHRRAVTLH